MLRKRLVTVSGAVLAALLLLSAAAVTAVFAQEPDPEAEPKAPFMHRFDGMREGRRGGFGGGMFGERADGPGTRMESLSEALGLTSEELRAELREGKTIEEIAEAQGVDLEALQEAWAAEREQATRDAIAQAVDDGTMSKEQAQWILEGLDKGFLPGLRDFGGGPGLRGLWFGGCPGSAPADDEATTTGTSA